MRRGCLSLKDKGQAFMPDFLASLVVFAVLISIFFYSWNTVISDESRLTVESQKMSEAENTATFLVNTPGYPEDWNSSNVEIPGFASSENVIEKEKLEEWDEISYDDQNRLLLSSNHMINIRDSEGDIVEIDGEEFSFGVEPENPTVVVPVTRNILFNSSEKTIDAELEYLVWR